MFRPIGSPGPRPFRLALVLGFAGLLALTACSNGSSNASPATTAAGPTPTAAPTSAPLSKTSDAATVAAVPGPSPTPSTAPATAATAPASTSGPAGAAGGPSRVKEIQAVTIWWVMTMQVRLHRTADPACVSSVLAHLSDADLGLMVAAATGSSGSLLGLSAAGNAVGGSLARCVATGTGLSSAPASSAPASAVQTTGAAGQCLLSTAEVSRVFDMDFKQPTNRLHVGPLGTANGCEFTSTASADHFVVVVLYTKIDSVKVKSFESARAKSIPRLGDAAYFSGTGLDVVIGTRMVSIEQEPFGDEDGLFAAAHLILSRLE